MPLFKLPKEFDKFKCATDIPITDNLLFRCKWPSSRDVSWASSYASTLSKGDFSFMVAYYSCIISAALVGIDNKPLKELASTDEEENDKKDLLFLLEKAEEELTDKEHAKLCEIKYEEVVKSIPTEIIKRAYDKHFNPWIKQKENEMHLAEVDAYDESLEDLPELNDGKN